jgi:hypothetical protein
MACFWRITVELINNDGVCNILHSHILKAYPTDITMTTLQQKTGMITWTFKSTAYIVRFRTCLRKTALEASRVWTVQFIIMQSITCQVLILRPFVVSRRNAVSKTTFVTMPVELSFPRLPMLISRNICAKELVHNKIRNSSLVVVNT